MKRAVRAGLTIAAAAILVPLAGPMASAVATPFTQAPAVNGHGPDDLLFYVANGLNPGTPVTVTIDGVGTTSYHGQLAVQTTTANGNVTSPATARTPADLVPGTYTLTFTQEASDAGPAVTLTTPTFTIVPPSIAPPGSYLPGQTLYASLLGLGGGPSVHRTDTLDGTPVTGSSYENLSLGYLQERIVLPTTLAPGAHTLRIAQDVNPAATVSTQFTVVQPTIAPSVTTTSTRGSFSVAGQSFGVDDVVDLAVTDAAGTRSALTTVSVGTGPFTATVDLQGVAAGTATVTATSEHNHAVATAQLTVLPSELRSPVILPANGKVQSSRALATLQMQPDGNLVLYVVGQARWSSRTNGHPGDYLAVQGDGNLVVYSPTGAVLWTAGTARQGAPVRLVVQDDGNVVLYSATGRAVWSTGTAGNPASTLLPGQGLVAGNRLIGPGRVVLSMQSDGNAVLYGIHGTVTWFTRTAGNPGAALKFQNDGEVCVYAAGGSLLFANHPTNSGGWRLVAQGDGNLVEYGQDGKAVWSSGTSGR